jgi:outer membrane lipoprotein SlyB
VQVLTADEGSHGMDPHEDVQLDPDTIDGDTVGDEEEHHATTGGAAAAGAVTGGVIGLTGGPIGAAIGAVGGTLLGVAAERMMHSDDDSERERDGTVELDDAEIAEGTSDVSSVEQRPA